MMQIIYGNYTSSTFGKKIKVRIRVTKSFMFEMAHALYGYDGPCRNIHGHSYRLELTVSGIPREDSAHPKNGMVVDFSDLKIIVKEEVVDVFDHSLVLNGNSPHRNIPGIEEHFEKVIFVPYQPTCEKMLVDFLGRIRSQLSPGLQLEVLRLQETATSYAEWIRTDQDE